MKQKYTIHYNQNLNKEQSKPYEIQVEEVGECPCCHFATSPTYLDGFMIASKDNEIPVSVFLVLYCPRCKNIYIAKYISKFGGVSNLELNFTFPQHSNLKVFSDGINEVSLEFVSIYNQALEAESNINTKGLAGLGYRKALEFLIKDYLIKLKHQDRNTIINLDLSKCIDKLNSDLKDIAKASVWIGNDETHYFRKNPDYDIYDLKLFIDCIVAEIDNEYAKVKARKMLHSK